ncbi:MAG: DUF6291 domain-containing protein [Bacteroidales bacterium]|nr:DUF6291 domain-containing protein [Bacteroidales bacterium]
MKTKNTRLVYTDEKNLKAYASLPAEDFKEFFMTYLTYQDGDDVSKTISNPFVQTLFMAAYADKITHNEKKWEDAAEKRRENGKKGGRPKKNNDITPNEEFDNTMTTVFPTKIEERQPDTKDVAKVEIQAQNADLSDNFDNYSERLSNLIDDNINKIRQSTDILAQKQVEIGSQMDNTVAFHRNVLYDMRKKLGWDTKDGIDFQQFIDEEINRKTVQIRYERAF